VKVQQSKVKKKLEEAGPSVRKADKVFIVLSVTQVGVVSTCQLL
jgi:hypothetical protein